MISKKSSISGQAHGPAPTSIAVSLALHQNKYIEQALKLAYKGNQNPGDD
jgi:hypothetical protein